ncbi:MAG: glutamyl-tRNA reductase [Chitinophagaceae bacterium]
MFVDKIYTFRIIGINYNKSDVHTRGLFVLKENYYRKLLEQSKTMPVEDVFVTSTCNRTEIYGLSAYANDLIDLLCIYTEGDRELFLKNAYIYEGEEAIAHLFRVAAGLDSQILGDYEVQGQIKRSFQIAREIITISGYTEKLITHVFESAKKIKTKTQLSGGTVSVSFAAVEYILEKYQHQRADLSIVLLGLGKIGRSTCKNFVTYMKTRNITVVNRTLHKAKYLAEKLGIDYVPFEQQTEVTQHADIIIVSTNSLHPTVTIESVNKNKPQCIIDLSIPSNVSSDVKELPHVDFIDIDNLSKIIDKTLQSRQQEIPKAEEIITKYQKMFNLWVAYRPNAYILNQTKYLFQAIKEKYCIVDTTTDEEIKKIINILALKGKSKNLNGADIIGAIADFIEKNTV